MLACILAFAAGAAWLQTRAELPPPHVALLVAAGMAAWGGLRRVRSPQGRVLASGVACATACAAGFCWAALLAGVRLADALAPGHEGQDLRLTGVVASLPQSFDRGVRFELAVESVDPAHATVPSRVALAWYGSWRRDVPAGAPPQVRAGERWTLAVRLKRPHGLANPHGFDYEAWLLERGVRATGYVRIGADHRKLDDLVHRPAWWIERLRDVIRARILTALPGGESAGVLVALAVGDQRSIPSAQWTVFTRTGVNHLMSISGLHVTMIAGLVYAFVFGLWRRIAALALRLPAQRAAALAGLFAALAYAALAGFAVPAQRTVYMLAVVAAALWVGRTTAASSVLGLALLVVVVIDPWAVLAPGFWLSFGAVALIMLVTAGRIRRMHWLTAWASTQWAVTLGLIPLLLALFQQVSLVSPIANAFAIPVVSLVVVPLALVGTVLPFDAVLAAAHIVMTETLRALEWLAAVPDAVWQQHAPPQWTVAVALAGIVWTLLPRGFPARWLGLFGLLPLFLVLPPRLVRGEVEVAVLDVGQGLAVVVRTRGHALLYDAGPAYSQEADAGSRVVVPYLRASGVRRLDGLIVTHSDNDHSGGAASVIAAVPTVWMSSSLPDSSPLHGLGTASVSCIAGQSWIWDGVRFEVLHPTTASYAVERMRANDRSCVLKVSNGRVRVLLTGDIESRSERELLQRDAAALRADVLVAPHHGSRTSSTAEFLDAVAPRIAIFTVGYRNRFGHPRPDVLERYRERGSRILRSDRHGAIVLRAGYNESSLRLHREERRRYWQAVPDDERANLGEE